MVVARLIRVEIRLDERRRSGQLLQLPAVEICDRNAQPIDLGERQFARIERVGDAAGKREQPVRVVAICVAQAFLDRRRFLAAYGAIAAGGVPDKDAVRTEHRAFGVNHDPAARRATRIQPTHLLETAIHPAPL
jgi:hypothetical protein